jgi:glycyl-tRNA synthetase alpha chain
LSPFTAVYALTKQKWNACYEQYSRRPSDGRFGQNPNRLSGYYQFQVILKPSPSNVQELYLKSLELFNIRKSTHDIRFVEDDWKNPSIGASGLGWEVWINGMEVTQFTYMKQLGGIELDVIPVEITYGVERIAMYIQDKDSILDLDYAYGVKYGDVFLQSEIDYCRFFQNIADVEKIKQYFSDCENEAKRLVLQDCTFPAYDFCLKASHYLNILDARGVLSEQERTSYLLRVRTIVKQVLEKFVSLKENAPKDINH